MYYHIATVYLKLHRKDCEAFVIGQHSKKEFSVIRLP